MCFFYMQICAKCNNKLVIKLKLIKLNDKQQLQILVSSL